MRERSIGIRELEANLTGCLEEVRSGTTLLLTEGERRFARLVPEQQRSESRNGSPITRSRRRLKKIKPKARLKGGGSMADIVRENRR